MKQKHQSVFLAGLLALAVGLSACSSWRGGGMDSSGTSGTAGETGSSGTGSQGGGSWGGASGSSGASGSAGAAGSSSGYDTSGAQAGGTAGMMQDQGTAMGRTSPNATVAAIEVMPRSGSATTEGESSAMGSTSGGTTGASPDRVYRVTLRMDDGSTQVVTQQTTPDFRTGDRVSLSGGAIRH